MPVGTEVRLDVRMVQRGLARSRGRAAELVAEGRVMVAGTPARKPAQVVGDDDVVQVITARTPEYVSRAAHKLAGALDAIEQLAPRRLRVTGARCVDAGASTGGFTQVLLERGADHVVAVDVGHGQLARSVADDPRVTVREGVNVRTLRPGDLGPSADLVVADLSFISLTLVLRPLLALAAPGGDLLVMVKPQFEVGRERLGASGVVTSSAQRHEVVLRVAEAALAAGARVRAAVPSTLPGSSGNREFFLWLGAPTIARSGGAGAETAEVHTPELTTAIETAITQAVYRDRAALVTPEHLS